MNTEAFTYNQLIRAAKSLFDNDRDDHNTEYARGICELIGRLRTDYSNGEGTGEEAEQAARFLGVEIK